MFGVLVKDCSDREYRHYKDIPDARGDKKKLHSIFQVKQEWINICFFIILKKKNNFIPNALQVIRSIQRPRVMHSS